MELLQESSPHWLGQDTCWLPCYNWWILYQCCDMYVHMSISGTYGIVQVRPPPEKSTTSTLTTLCLPSAKHIGRCSSWSQSIYPSYCSTKNPLTMMQFCPMWTYEPMLATLTMVFSPMNTLSPTCREKNADLHNGPYKHTIRWLYCFIVHMSLMILSHSQLICPNLV